MLLTSRNAKVEFYDVVIIFNGGKYEVIIGLSKVDKIVLLFVLFLVRKADKALSTS